MDPDEAQEWLRSWAAGVSERAAAAVALSDRVAKIKTEADGLDGAVRARVDSTGRLIDLELTESVHEVPADQLAQEILATVARAQHHLNALVAEAVEATVGRDSETGRAVLDSFAKRFPDPDEERMDAGSSWRPGRR